MELRSDRTRRLCKFVLLHERPCCRPIGVAIKNSTDDAAINDLREGLVVRGRCPRAKNDFWVGRVWDTFDTQPKRVCRSAAKANRL